MQHPLRPALKLLLALLAVSAAWADEASKRTKIEEMLKVTGAQNMVDQMFDQIKKSALQSMPTEAQSDPDFREAQDKIFDLMKNRLSWTKMQPVYLKIYADTFTEDEIDGMLTFYRSPSGQSMLKKMPMLMGQTMSVTQQEMKDIYPEIQKIMNDAKAKHDQKKTAK